MKKLLLYTCSVALVIHGLSATCQSDSLPDPVPETDAGMDYRDALEREAEYNEGLPERDDPYEPVPAFDGRKISLNRAGEEELRTIPGLSPGQAAALFDHIALYGDILSAGELIAVPGFDSVLVKKILPFLRMGPGRQDPAVTPANLVRYGRHELSVTAGRSLTGSTEGSDEFTGDPGRLRIRYLFNGLGKIRAGLAGDKDAGEKFPGKTGFDFYAGYLSLQDIGVIKRLVIGNFRCGFGQGLTMGNGRGPERFPGFYSERKAGTGLRPSTGLNETDYLRGVAATLAAGPVKGTVFFSRHPRDGAVTPADSSPGSQGVVTSPGTTGYHRTPGEMARRNAYSEMAAGVNLTARFSPDTRVGIRLGGTFVYFRNSLFVAPSTGIQHRFDFMGRVNHVAGVDLQVRLPGFHLFAEMARSRNGGMGAVGGIAWTSGNTLRISLLVRDYGRTYQNRFAASTGQASVNAAERGIGLSAELVPGTKLTINGFTDLYAYRWFRYRIAGLTTGREAGLSMAWRPEGVFSLRLRYTYKSEEANGIPGEAPAVHKLVPWAMHTLRGQAEWTVSERWRFSSRAEIRFYNPGNPGSNLSRGSLFYQEAGYTGEGIVKKIALRLTLFDVSGYASRIYAYEPELPQGYTVTAFQGEGGQAVLIAAFRFHRRVELWLRGSVLKRTDRSPAGIPSGLNAGGIATEVTGQVRFR